MTTINNGGPAFPVPGLSGDEAFDGMTLRDYFAAKAVIAMLTEDGTTNFAQRAKEAYEVADAMLKAREVQQ